MRAIVIVAAFVLGGCAGNPPRTCTQESRDALVVLYKKAAEGVIESGACDNVQRVEHCAAYMQIEAAMAMSQKAMCE